MARTSVGTLSIIVGANIRSLNRGLQRAGQRLGRFARTVGRVGRRMGRFAVGVSAASGALTLFATRAQIRAIDEMHHFSRQTNVAIEQLAGLQHAAELTGSSAESLRSSLQRMNRRIGLAAQGSGEARDALQQLGISAREISGMGADKQFSLIADRIASVGDAGQQAAFAFRIFGRQGQELLPMLRQGSEGLEAAQRQADQFGASVSAMDAENVAKVQDAFARMRLAITGAARQLAVRLAPAIEGLGNFMTSVVSNQADVWSAVFGGIFRFVRNTFTRISKAVGGFANLSGQAFGFVEGVIKNWRSVLSLAFNTASLHIVRFANQVHHFFTEVIPSVLTWFARNWRDIFGELFRFTRQFFGNVARATIRFWSNIPKVISGELRPEHIFQEMTRGLHLAFEEAPNIAAREMGALEKELSGRVSKMSEEVGDELHSIMQTRAEQAERFAKAFRSLFDSPDDDDLGFDRGALRGIGEEVGQGFNDKAGEDTVDLIRAGTAQAQLEAFRMQRRDGRRDGVEKQQLSAMQGTKKAVEGLRRDMASRPGLAAAELTP